MYVMVNEGDLIDEEIFIQYSDGVYLIRGDKEEANRGSHA